MVAGSLTSLHRSATVRSVSGRGPRHRRERGQDPSDREEGAKEDLLPPLGLSERHPGDAGGQAPPAAPGGGPPRGGAGDAAEDPPRAGLPSLPEDLPGGGAQAQGAAAAGASTHSEQGA